MSTRRRDTWTDDEILDEEDLTSLPDDESPDGRYTLGGVLGRGGMADVRAATDHKLRREVAIKVLRAVTPGQRARFLAEAEITARLEHPNVVPVQDLGEMPDGTPYLVMKQVRGRSLALLQSEGRLSLEATLGIFRKVCDALAFAHARGVLHRDLKPENVMVGEFGEVLLMDWGIAWSMEAAGPEAGTRRRGELAGTPAFMSPEQAAGAPEGLDARSDIYGLGAVLYALLTGEAPLSGEPDRVLEDVRRGAIRPPRALRPDLPAELERIVLRAMALRPEDRYPSVRALIEDIDAFLERRPLVHERSTRAERLSKWLDRHRSAVRSALVVAGVALLALLAGLWRYTADIGAARDDALDAAERATDAEARAVTGLLASSVALADTLESQGLLLEAQRHLEAAQALAEGRDLDRRVLDFALSAHVAASPPPVSRCAPHGDRPATALDLGPEGRWVASWGADARLVVWDPMDCAARATLPLGSAAGPGVIDATRGRAAVVVDGQLALISLDPGGGAPREERRVQLPFQAVALGTDGPTVWVRDAEAAVWALDDSTATLRPLSAPAVGEALWRPAADGRLWIADSTRSGRELGGAWDSGSGQKRWIGDGVNAIAATEGGDLLLTGTAMGAAALDRQGRELWNSGLYPVDTVGIAPGGRVGWVTGFDGSVWLVDLGSGRALAAFVGPGQRPTAINATNDAALLSVGRASGQIETYLWSGQTGTPEREVEEQMLQGLAISPDGLLFATGRDDGLISLYDRATGRLLRTWGPHRAAARQMAFSPDGTRLAVAMRTEGVALIDLASGEERRFPLVERTVTVAWLGAELYTVDVTGELLHLDLASGQAVPVARGLRAPSWGLAPLGTDRLITAGHLDGEHGIVVLDAHDGGVARRIPLDEGVYHVAASPDLERVAVVTHGGDLRVYALDDGAELLRVHADAGPTMGVAWSPDGTLIATTGYSRQVRVWDARSGALLRSAGQHEGPGLNVAFTPDGAAIYSGGTEGFSVLPLEAHRRHLEAVAALRGPLAGRAAALGALGWWSRVEDVLGQPSGDGRLLAQARLALLQPPPSSPSGDLYQALLAGAPRP